MRQHLFVYGTLMAASICREIIGRVPESIPATLTEFSRWAVRDERYPAILPDPHGMVAGLLLRNLDERELADLDAYEGVEYLRTKISVHMESEEEVLCWAYVWQDSHLRLEEQDWDAASFLTRHDACHEIGCSEQGAVRHAEESIGADRKYNSSTFARSTQS